MNDKYELLHEDTVTVNGKTLYRIRALCAGSWVKRDKWRGLAARAR
jgi:hypothetical protein